MENRAGDSLHLEEGTAVYGCGPEWDAIRFPGPALLVRPITCVVVTF